MPFAVFGLSAALVLSLLFFMSPNVMEAQFWSAPTSFLILFVSVAVLGFGCLPLFKMKTIQIDPQRIVFKNYMFQSYIRTVHFKEYDCYKTVHEESENGLFEAVWLLKDGKLADSFSNYQYTNYDALKSALILKNKGTLNMSPTKQLWCHLGAKI